MKNKRSFILLIIFFCGAWNLAFAMNWWCCSNKKSYQETSQRSEVHNPQHLRALTESQENTTTTFARFQLERGIGLQKTEDATSLSPEEVLEKKFQALFSALGFSEEEQQDLHRYLKQLQQAKSSNIQGVNFSWNEEQQQFISLPSNTISNNSLIEVIQVLNEYVAYDRERQRADRLNWQQQDSITPRLLETMLSPSINQQHLRLQIAHDRHEETLSSDLFSEQEPGAPQPHSILLFGFNVPGKGGPRLQIKEKIKSHLEGIIPQAMNDYNKAIGLKASGIKFSEYLEFIHKIKRGTLCSEIVSPTELANLSITRQQAQAWATFLENKLAAFDFSRKVFTLEAQQRFVAKNYKHITKNKVSDILQQAFLNNHWENIVSYLKPIFDCLHHLSNRVISPVLLEDEIEQAIEELKRQACFSNDSSIISVRQKDLHKVLESIVSEAFFRKTSKLGLEFGREQNNKVAFVWSHLFPTAENQAPSTLSSLQEFRSYIERKPYYTSTFRSNLNGAKYPEAITCSEARHLGRLSTKGEAPPYLLIRGIIPSTTSVSNDTRK